MQKKEDSFSIREKHVTTYFLTAFWMFWLVTSKKKENSYNNLGSNKRISVEKWQCA